MLFRSQSRHFLDTLWIDRESSCLLDSFSTPGGSIELLFLILMCCSSIPSRHLSCRRAFSRHPLDRSFDTTRYLHLSRFTSCPIYGLCAIRKSFFFDLSLDTSLLLSQNTIISLQTCSSRILQAFSSFSLLGKLLILSHSCISCFET